MRANTKAMLKKIEQLSFMNRQLVEILEKKQYQPTNQPTKEKKDANNKS